MSVLTRLGNALRFEKKKEVRSKLIHARTFVTRNYLYNLAKELKYHNAHHTTHWVYEPAMHLAKEEGIPLEGQLLIGIAALFHDTGFVDVNQDKKWYSGNEKRGAEYAAAYMKEEGYTEEEIRIVYNLIMVTDIRPDFRKDPEELTHMEKIMRDADLSYIGESHYSEYQEQAKGLFEELNTYVFGGQLKWEKWVEMQIGFLASFNWLTQTAIANYSRNKHVVVESLKHELKELNSRNVGLPQDQEETSKEPES